MTSNIYSQAVLCDDISADDEFITAAEFEDATRTVVKTLGRNFDLDVVFAGNGALTDGKMVMLPAQDPAKLMTKKQYAVGQGFANHETLHNLCTDIEGLKPEMKRLGNEGKKLALRMCQAIEDVRIERAGIKLYPGMKDQLTSTADFVCKEFIDEVYPEKPDIVTDFKRIGPVAITWRGRQRLGYASPYINKCLELFSPEMLAKLDKWCDMIEALPDGAAGPGDFDQQASFAGSREAVRLAELLAGEIDPQKESKEEPAPSPAGNEGAKGNNQNPNGGSDKPGGGKQNAQAPGSGAGGPDTGDDILDPDMSNSIQKLLAEGNDMNGKHGWRPITTALDCVLTRDTEKHSGTNQLKNPKNLNTYLALVSEIGGRTAVMKRKLERALLAASEAEYVSGQRTGRLDVRRRGVDIMSGRENIYRRKLEGKSFDTAISILVDASGSMRSERMKLASQTCVALAECFERTTVDLEILAFSAHTEGGMFSMELRDKIGTIINKAIDERDRPWTRPFHRADAVTIYEIKSFDDSLRAARLSMGAMPGLATGNTPDGDAILKGAARLLAMPNAKKIMFVLTDGSPGYRVVHGDTACKEYTRRAIAYATKRGITVVGVGIQTGAGRDVYKNWTTINDLDDLDKGVMDKVARLIIGENFKVDNADVSGVAANFKMRA